MRTLSAALIGSLALSSVTPAHAVAPPMFEYTGSACPQGSVQLSKDMRILSFSALQAHSTGPRVLASCKVYLRAGYRKVIETKDGKKEVWVPYLSRLGPINSIGLGVDQGVKTGKASIGFSTNQGGRNLVEYVAGARAGSSNRSLGVSFNMERDLSIDLSLIAEGQGSTVKVTKIELR